ncbi:MAG TPA: ATP-binding protein [Vicinamibacterales bacterium]|jgi:signal transduction histidine kinase|nr:ATP-binding protein [Vicinamibacterales bacterium]
MSERVDVLARDYSIALEQYLAEQAEPGLERAYELGRRALAEGSGVLEMATVHSRALPAALASATSETDRVKRLEAIERFFVEASSPFEMAFLSFREANVVLHRLNDVLEGQARRIAHALHDEAAQLLASVHLALADIGVRYPDTAKAQNDVRGLLEQIEERLRNLSHELRPPILEDLGLVPALEFLADSVHKRWGLAVTVQALINGGVPATIETTLYRIIHEALINVVRHAKATRADVALRREAHRIVCSVRDDGIGLDASVKGKSGRSGLGLVEIQERTAALGGVLRLEPNVGRGTDLSVEIPLER